MDEKSKYLQDIVESKVNEKVSEELGKEDKKIDEKNLTESLKKEDKKLIKVKDLNREEQDKLNYSFKELGILREEIVNKIENIAAQMEIIKKKVETIKQSGKIKINEEDEKKNEEGVKQYMVLLQSILSEVTSQLQYFSNYFSDKKPEKIIVPKNESDDFSEYILGQVKGMNRYIKKVRKNLNVIFSRYQISFKSEISNLEHLQRYLKALELADKKQK